MKKIISTLILAFVFYSCSSNNDDIIDNEQNSISYSSCNFQGRTYVATNYLLEIPVDFNNDGHYSNDLILEDPF